MMLRSSFYLLLIAVAFHSCIHNDHTFISIYYNQRNQETNFGVTELCHFLKDQSLNYQVVADFSKPIKFKNRAIFLLNQEEIGQIVDSKIPKKWQEQVLQKEGFAIHTLITGQDTSYWVVGGDSAGTMYGGIELGEILAEYGFGKEIELTKEPYFKKRGTKFNLPMDVRSPTYTEASDAAQKNMIHMWDFDFWKSYIDLLAKYRYNFISLWNLHPFPSMVKVPDYPLVALDDVLQSRGMWKENYSTRTADLDAPEIMEEIAVIKKITIEEKINFWRKVMAYGKSRNVDFYVVTWNIYTYGVDGKYGITNDINNETTKDYYRQSVKAMYDTYPLLAGIGLTTGENIEGSPEEKEDWVWDTYGLGTLDAAEAHPDRKITLIHRQHEAGAEEIRKKFAPLAEHKNVNFLFSFKYAQAHVYSSVKQTFHENFVKDLQGSKTLWTMRNDDVYLYRWAAPDFVRSFLKNVPIEVSEGFYLGSDQYVWGRTFLDLPIEEPLKNLELSKHWLQWSIWGRLGYDTELSNDRLVTMINQRWGIKNGKDLLEIWQHASMTYPITTGFHWGALDFQWYIEACKSRPEPAQTESGFHDVNRFITLGCHPGTNNVSIPEYVSAEIKKEALKGISPIQVSDSLHFHADLALKGITLFKQQKPGSELDKTIQDIETMALLGKYYAHKIRAATAVAMYRAKKVSREKEIAIEELKQAASFWGKYTTLSRQNYMNPLWTNRVGIVDWAKLEGEVIKDIEIARNL